MSRKPLTFFEAVMAEFRAFPRAGWLLVCGWGVTQWGLALIGWARPTDTPSWVSYLALLTIPCLFAISYFCISRLVEMPMTWRKGLRFFATAAAIVATTLMLLVGALFATRTMNLLWSFAAAAPALLGLFVACCMVGWPVWQLASLRPIGPLTAWRATKGIRWALFMAVFLPTLSASKFLL